MSERIVRPDEFALVALTEEELMNLARIAGHQGWSHILDDAGREVQRRSVRRHRVWED